MPSDLHPDWRADLNEHNLYYYVTSGPSQLKRGLDSPMLELAHERQFAIAQIGTSGAKFEVEHSARVQSALRLLENSFTAHYTEDLCRPKSPHAETLVDLRKQAQPFIPLPILDLNYPSPSTIATPSPKMVLQRSTRSPLALQELMNPAPPPSSTLKRKASQDFDPIRADEESRDLSEIRKDLSAETMPPIKYSRAYHVLGEGNVTRTHRGVRMRRSKSVARHASLEDPYDTEQLEKDGELLLNLSQSRGLTRR